MAIFRRKKEVVDEVPELEHYYAERRTSSIWSWVMAIVTMLLTVLIILGLFYGGRWVYRELTKDDANPQPAPTVTAPQNPPTQTNQGVTTLPSGESSTSNSGQSGTSNTGGGTPAPSGTSTTGGTSNTGSSSTSGSSATNTPSEIPNSGPGEVIMVSVIAAIAGYLVMASKLARKTDN